MVYPKFKCKENCHQKVIQLCLCFVEHCFIICIISSVHPIHYPLGSCSCFCFPIPSFLYLSGGHIPLSLTATGSVSPTGFC